MTRKYSLPILFSKNILLPKIFSLALVSLVLNSCIEEFNPDLNGSVELIVIDGKIIKGELMQQVVVSRSTPVNNNEFKPIKSCTVWVVDDANRAFYFEEKSDGIYQAEIPEEYLAYNSRFKLRVTTPNKDEYESDYATILESSPIDSVYYAIESYQSSSEYYNKGLQFYTDLKAPDKNTKNYRWKLIETWEYRSNYLIGAIWDSKKDTLYHYSPETDSLYYCWSTQPINELYTSSTENLTVNEKKKNPLSYVPINSYKLIEKYSLLVQQYALTDEAYVYWDKNKVQARESGGLYQTQPSQSKSNIHNLNDATEVILGFFWASSFTEKRLFFDGLLSIPDRYICPVDTMELAVLDSGTSIRDLDNILDDLVNYLDADVYYSLKVFGDYVYLMGVGINTDGTLLTGTKSAQYCLDCRKQGGTNIKPDFWED